MIDLFGYMSDIPRIPKQLLKLLTVVVIFPLGVKTVKEIKPVFHLCSATRW